MPASWTVYHLHPPTPEAVRLALEDFRLSLRVKPERAALSPCNRDLCASLPPGLAVEFIGGCLKKRGLAGPGKASGGGLESPPVLNAFANSFECPKSPPPWGETEEVAEHG